MEKVANDETSLSFFDAYPVDNIVTMLGVGLDCQSSILLVWK